MRADLQRLKRDSDPRQSAIPASRPAKWKFIVPAMAILAALALVAWLNPGGLRDRFWSKGASSHIESLAVLPLENLSGDPNQEVFANGMTEALITELSKIKALKKVISRTSVMQYKGTKKPMKQIAGELGVDALVEGSTIREGGRVRVTVQVIEGSTDAHIWADNFDREYKDILALHSDVAQAIAREVKATLSPEETAALARKGTANPEAYDYYLRGMGQVAIVNELNLRIAMDMFENAIRLDPNFAEAYAALSSVHTAVWWDGFDRTAQRVALAKAAVDKAFQLRRDLPEAHLAMGLFYYMCHLDYDHALREFEAAQKSLPNNARVYYCLGLMLRRQGKREQSIANLTKAYELDPISVEYASQAALTYSVAGNLKESVRYYDISIRLAPGSPSLYATKALVILGLSGDITQARAAIEPALRLKFENYPLIAYCRDLIDLYAGNIQDAIKRISSESWEPIEGQENFTPRELLQAQLYGLDGQRLLERSCYEAAVKIIMAKIKEHPEKAAYHSALGIAYAGLGRKQDAIREAKAGMELKPAGKDVGGYYQIFVLAQIYTTVGEYDEALRLLEGPLSKHKSGYGNGTLRLDPVWKPLRDNPRFQALLQK